MRWTDEDLADFKRRQNQDGGKRETLKPARAKPEHHEDREQMALFEWMRKLARWRGRPLDEFYVHVPNQKGTRSSGELARLAAMGVRPGHPDIHGRVPAGGYHSHYIELKRVGGDKPTAHQLQEHQLLRALGHRVDVAFGWEEARHAIERHLAGSGWPIVITTGVVEVDFSTWNIGSAP